MYLFSTSIFSFPLSLKIKGLHVAPSKQNFDSAATATFTILIRKQNKEKGTAHYWPHPISPAEEWSLGSPPCSEHAPPLGHRKGSHTGTAQQCLHISPEHTAIIDQCTISNWFIIHFTNHNTENSST